jgi:hypothetical protein
MNALPAPENQLLANRQETAVKAVRSYLQATRENLTRAGNHALDVLTVYSVDRAGLPEWGRHRVNAYLHPEWLDPAAQRTEKTTEETALSKKIYDTLNDRQSLRGKTWQEVCDEIDPFARAVITSAQNIANKAESDAKFQASVNLGATLFEQLTLRHATAEVDAIVAAATAHSDPATIARVEAAMDAHERAVEQENAELQQQINANLHQLNRPNNQPPARPASSCCAIL